MRNSEERHHDGSSRQVRPDIRRPFSGRDSRLGKFRIKHRGLWLAIGALLVASIGAAYELTPEQVLENTAAVYEEMQTYQATGTSASVIHRGTGEPYRLGVSFTIKLKKPNLYLITWQGTASAPRFDRGGAVWSDGTPATSY